MIDSISTEEINLSKLTESGEIDVKLDLPENSTVTNDEIKVKIELEQTREIESVPIDIINGDGIDVSFENQENDVISLTIIGTEKNVKDLTEEDFSVSIDVAGLITGEHTLPIKVEGPDDIKVTTKVENIKVIISEN